MNILILGCTRAAVGLAQRLQAAGHELAVLDSDPAPLAALTRQPWFDGLTHCGLPVDADTLLASGIESSDAVFALTGDDTVNIMAAQIAQQQYHIRRVWARIDDPALKQAYGRYFSIWTVCPGDLTADALYQSFVGSTAQQSMAFGNDMVHFSQIEPPPQVLGRTLAQLATAELAAGDLDADGTPGMVLGLVCESGELVLAAEQPDRRLVKGDTLVTVLKAPGAALAGLRAPRRRGRKREARV